MTKLGVPSKMSSLPVFVSQSTGKKIPSVFVEGAFFNNFFPVMHSASLEKRWIFFLKMYLFIYLYFLPRCFMRGNNPLLGCFRTCKALQGPEDAFLQFKGALSSIHMQTFHSSNEKSFWGGGGGLGVQNKPQNT